MQLLLDLPNVKSHQWNVSIQKSLPKDSALTVSYVGNRSLDLVTLSDWNAVQPGSIPTCRLLYPIPNLERSRFTVTWEIPRIMRCKLDWNGDSTMASPSSFLILCKHIGEAEGGIWDTPTPFAPQGYNRGRSSLDRTHLLTVNGVWRFLWVTGGST